LIAHHEGGSDIANSPRVIDWDFARNAPLQSVVRFPVFIADISGWRSDGLEAGMAFESDRLYLVQAFQKEESRRGLDSTISTLLAASSERHFFLKSLYTTKPYIESLLPNIVYELNRPWMMLELN
jgi:hypothetical protein